ncbi:MAG: cell division protein FtsL [Alphaproteobacteria bacterium]|nr:cell division protein FtsL [Alphaproteobacteria bacterium]
MHKFLNAVLVLTVLVSGFVLYSLEHATRDLERQLTRSEKAIVNEHESIKFLNAEWSSLTRPDRLKALAELHLGMQPLQAGQIVGADELGGRVPAEPVIKLETAGSDPIGAIIEKMR